jgi:hypothetical protein
MKKIVFLLLIIGCVLVGCYNDKADMVNPNAAMLGCDTTAVSYSGTISSIISGNNCNTCHGSAVANSAGGSIVLDNYTGVQAAALSGQLIPAVRQDASCTTCNPAYPSYHPMPLSGSKLDDCSINKIIAWVNQGAKNN